MGGKSGFFWVRGSRGEKKCVKSGVVVVQDGGWWIGWWDGEMGG